MINAGDVLEEINEYIRSVPLMKDHYKVFAIIVLSMPGIEDIEDSLSPGDMLFAIGTLQLPYQQNEYIVIPEKVVEAYNRKELLKEYIDEPLQAIRLKWDKEQSSSHLRLLK